MNNISETDAQSLYWDALINEVQMTVRQLIVKLTMESNCTLESKLGFFSKKTFFFWWKAFSRLNPLKVVISTHESLISIQWRVVVGSTELISNDSRQKKEKNFGTLLIDFCDLDMLECIIFRSIKGISLSKDIPSRRRSNDPLVASEASV